MRDQRAARFFVLLCGFIGWTGCSSPTRPAEVIPAPVLPVVPDVRPAAGTHPYRLTLHLPQCKGHGGEPWEDFIVDDTLVVQGGSLQMTLPDGNQPWEKGIPRLTLTIQRSGSQLSGTIGGKAELVHRNTYGRGWLLLALWLNKANRPGLRWEERGERGQIPSLTGTTDNEGRLTGTFDGYATGEMIVGGIFGCPVQGATFMLEPLS